MRRTYNDFNEGEIKELLLNKSWTIFDNEAGVYKAWKVMLDYMTQVIDILCPISKIKKLKNEIRS